MNTFFSINNLTISYENILVKESRVLDNVSFDVYDNQITFVHGDNGSGKTSLFRALLGLYEPECDFIRIPNREKLISAKEFCRNKRIGYIPQFPEEGMVPTLPIIDNIFLREKLFSIRKGRWLAPGFRNSDIARLEAILDRFPIAKEIISGRYFDNHTSFSGGQLQILNLVAVALADIELIVMDEPTGKLDENNRRLFWETLSDILSDAKIVALCITHDSSYRATRLIAHNARVMKIENGRITPS